MKFKSGNRWKNSKGQLRYKPWRKLVFELNKRKIGISRHYVCVKCNKKRKTTRVLHAHHIFSWDKFEKKRYDRYNGVVLCWKCHNGFHRKYVFCFVKLLVFIGNWTQGNPRCSGMLWGELWEGLEELWEGSVKFYI